MDLLQAVPAAELEGRSPARVLEGLFLGFLIYFGVLIWQAGIITPGTLVILIGGILLFTMVFSIWWPQVVLFDQIPVYGDEGQEK